MGTKTAYIGVNNNCKQLSTIYGGVNNVPKKIIRAYVGDNNNVPKIWWDGGNSSSIINDKLIFSNNETSECNYKIIEFVPNIYNFVQTGFYNLSYLNSDKLKIIESYIESAYLTNLCDPYGYYHKLFSIKNEILEEVTKKLRYGSSINCITISENERTDGGNHLRFEIQFFEITKLFLQAYSVLEGNADFSAKRNLNIPTSAWLKSGDNSIGTYLGYLEYKIYGNTYNFQKGDFYTDFKIIGCFPYHYNTAYSTNLNLKEIKTYYCNKIIYFDFTKSNQICADASDSNIRRIYVLDQVTKRRIIQLSERKSYMEKLECDSKEGLIAIAKEEEQNAYCPKFQINNNIDLYCGKKITIEIGNYNPWIPSDNITRSILFQFENIVTTLFYINGKPSQLGTIYLSWQSGDGWRLIFQHYQASSDGTHIYLLSDQYDFFKNSILTIDLEDNNFIIYKNSELIFKDSAHYFKGLQEDTHCLLTFFQYFKNYNIKKFYIQK